MVKGKLKGPDILYTAAYIEGIVIQDSRRRFRIDLHTKMYWIGE